MTVGGMRYLEPENENDFLGSFVTPHYLQVKIDFVNMCDKLKIRSLDDLD